MKALRLWHVRRRAAGLFCAALVGLAIPAGAQTTAATPPAAGTGAHLPSRVFIDVSAGYHFGTLDFSETRSDPYFAETKSWTAKYSVKNGPSFEIGGAFRVWRNLMAAAAYSRFEDSQPASITGSVPNPFFFNRNRSIEGESAPLAHTEQTVHLDAMWAAAVSRSLEVGIFAGPSFFSLRQSYVGDVQFDDGYPYTTATFTRAVATDGTESTTGFNVGGSVAWYFTRHLGVSGTLRYSSASATLTTAAGNAVPVTLGGMETAVGLRISGGR